MGISDVITLLGGVALFLFGMSLMGDGLKKVAGNKLELVLYRLSSTPIKGVLLGTGVTAVIQSSSATSVMVVGFVNSGMMQVKQAIGVVMGAILGTSITGWLLCLSDLSGGSGWISGHRKYPHGLCGFDVRYVRHERRSGSLERERGIYRSTHQLFQSVFGHSGGYNLHQRPPKRICRCRYYASIGYHRRCDL